MASAQRSVAIVDDSDSIRHSLAFALRAMGRHSLSFASAHQFLASDLASYSCIILDYDMPTMTGVELARNLRRQGCDLPILLSSGNLPDVARVEARELGIEICDKPARWEDIFAFTEAAAK